ncbi:MAG TPA: SCO family protein [Gammaproteobacteria bacterium]|jgi:protein SCO1/2|nr:SCO family protein [Gammaproteobacteria bacterium]
MKRIGLFLLSFMLLSGCGQQAPQKPWGLLNLTGHMPDLQFNLTRDDGQPVDQSAFLGKLTLLYFGYTHCPDVCPTTLADLGTAIRQLGAQANQVQVLFVSVDPARDTPTVLKKYVNAFGPWFVGLTGSQAQLQALTKRYRVAYRLGEPDAQGNYTVYHSSAIFIFDKQGKARLLAGFGDKPDVVATDLKRLLAE